MATNPPKGDGHRNGAVRERSQTYNPKTGIWTKRDANTGRFMDGKKTEPRSRVSARKNNSGSKRGDFRLAMSAYR